jgi:hypothetical protein
LSQAMWIGLAGLAAGLALALALTRFLKSILYDIRPTDPLTFGSVCLLLRGALIQGHGSKYLQGNCP